MQIFAKEILISSTYLCELFFLIIFFSLVLSTLTKFGFFMNKYLEIEFFWGLSFIENLCFSVFYARNKTIFQKFTQINHQSFSNNKKIPHIIKVAHKTLQNHIPNLHKPTAKPINPNKYTRHDEREKKNHLFRI